MVWYLVLELLGAASGEVCDQLLLLLGMAT